jgi:hypothetical protein
MEPLQQQQVENIARAEMARRRRQLGNLTPEQEMNIETLLILTANQVSKMVTAMELKLSPSRRSRSFHSRSRTALSQFRRMARYARYPLRLRIPH